MLFSFSEYAHISKALCGLTCLQPGQFSITRRENQELHAAVHKPGLRGTLLHSRYHCSS